MAVLLLPENLCYNNTTAPGIILLIDRAKRHPSEILLINASKLFAKGRPKNYLAEEHIETIAAIYHHWGPVGANGSSPISAIITREEAARNDYNLSPSRDQRQGRRAAAGRGHGALARSRRGTRPARGAFQF